LSTGIVVIKPHHLIPHDKEKWRFSFKTAQYSSFYGILGMYLPVLRFGTYNGEQGRCAKGKNLIGLHIDFEFAVPCVV
jgi:hypothetical protein